jgi:hypothetical protein
LILVQRVPRRLEFPRRHRFIRRVDDDGWHGCFRNGVSGAYRSARSSGLRPDDCRKRADCS